MREKISEEPNFPEKKTEETKYPYSIKNPEAVKILDGLLKDEMITNHLKPLINHESGTGIHSINVGTLCADLSIELGLNESQVKKTATGGLLHDIGKCAVPQEILTSPHKLDEAQKEIIKQHPSNGFKILQNDINFETHPDLVDVKKLVVGHHEKKSYHPYPRKKTDSVNLPDRRHESEDIDIMTLIVAVADTFDALASKRSYKESLDKEEIKKLLEEEFAGHPKLQLIIDGVLERLEPKN